MDISTPKKKFSKQGKTDSGKDRVLTHGITDFWHRFSSNYNYTAKKEKGGRRNGGNITDQVASLRHGS
jgi:hypothetical protein